MAIRVRRTWSLLIVLVSVLSLPALGQEDCDILITPPDDPAAPRFRLEVSNGCTPCELGPGGCLHQDPWQSDIDGFPFIWQWAYDEGPEVWETADLRCLSDGAHLLTVENVDYTGWTDCWCRSGPQTFPFNITRSDGEVASFQVVEGNASVSVDGEFSPAAIYKISAINLDTGTETVVYEGVQESSFSVPVPSVDAIYVLEQTNACTEQGALLVAVPEALDSSCTTSGGTCCAGTCFGGPVKSATGNMRYADTDPLPGWPLQRTYDSARPSPATARFGAGWFSIFDAKVAVSAYDRVVLVTEDAELYVFRSQAGAYEQEWPAAIGTARATLENDTYFGGWLFRRPDGRTTYRYDTSGVREIRSIDTGRAIAIEYDGFGRPSAVTDSWSAWRLDVALDPESGRIAAISVADDPTLGWQYVYTGDKLTSVLSASDAPWRTYEYGTSLQAVRDPLGNLIESHTFDGNRAVSDTSPGSEIVSVTYNHPGRVPGERYTETTSAAGAVTRYYSRPIAGSRRIVEVDGTCDCGQEDVVYAHGLLGQILREQDALGYVTEYTFSGDGMARLSTRTAMAPSGCDPATDPTRCRLTPDALRTATLTPAATSTLRQYEYDDPAWPEKVTEVRSQSVASPGHWRVEQYTYHAEHGGTLQHMVTGYVSPGTQESRTTLRAYYEGSEGPRFAPPLFIANPGWAQLPQPGGLLAAADGSRTDADDVTEYVYYPSVLPNPYQPIDPPIPATWRGRLAAVRNAAGHVTTYEDYDAWGNAKRVIDRNGVVTELTFDALSRVLTSTVRGAASCNTAVDPLCGTDLSTVRTYAAELGPLESEQRPGGGVTAYQYDSRGRVATMSRGPSVSDLRERMEYSYDPLSGHKSLERWLAFETGAWIERKGQAYAYDPGGRLEEVTHPDGASSGYTYDPAGRVLTVRDENHLAPNTVYTYDPAGRLIEVVQTLASAPGGSIATLYGYDADGNLTSVTDPNGNVTSYFYDDFGQMLWQQSPVTGTTTYAYDSGGNLATTIDANSSTTTRTYDAAGRLLSATSTGVELPTEVVAYTYDGDPCGAGNGIGRPATMTDPTGETTYCYERRGLLAATTDGAEHATQFFYDAGGNRSAIHYPSTRAVTYTHDYAGRPLSVTANGVPIVTAASYLPFGPLTYLDFGNGTARTMTHDTRYRPQQNVLAGLAGIIASYTYEADAVGNITGIHDDVDAAYNRDFAYDDLNRLIAANSGASLWGSGGYTYDAMGNMTSLLLGSRSLSFSYDGTTPKLLTVTGTNPATMTYDPAGNESGSYNARNQMADGGAYRYDGRGLRVYAQKYGWPSLLMLKQHSVYNPELRLLARTDWSYYSLDGVFAGTDYLWFGDLPVAQIPAYFLDQPPLYTFTDHLGTPIVQTDASAEVVWRAEYEPYGVVYAYRTGAAVDQILRLPGQEVDELIGEDRYYNVFRWYRGGWGRYTQADPIGFNGGTNLYAYVGGNPINASDPLGLKAELVCRPVKPGGWAGAVIGVIGFFTNFKPLHCRLRVTCPCSDGQGDPKAPFDKTAGWENITGQGLTLTQDEYLAAGYDDGFFGPWFPVPVQSKASGCDFERCVLSLHKNMGSNLPPYNAIGPNSNSYVNHLIKSCGGSANFPHGAIGGSPNPWYGGGGFN